MRLVGADREAVLAVFERDVPVRIARLAEHVAAIEAADTTEARREALAALAHEVHNIRGAAATVQLGLLQSLSMDVELAIDELLESRASGTDGLAGATSRLIAQLEQLAKGTAEQSPPTSPKQLGDRPIVLHVEDNASNLKLVERVLARRPAVQVVEATSGEEGFQLAKSLAPALVLLDLRLGETSGEDVLERLRADPVTRGLRVVVVSAEARPAEASRLIALGADDYLVKPIEIEALLELVDSALEAAEQ